MSPPHGQITLEVTIDSALLRITSPAFAIVKATEPENTGWVETTIDKNQVKATIKAKSLGSLREAAEDFMACVAVAEKVVKE
mgnify:CR=1 FL=1